MVGNVGFSKRIYEAREKKKERYTHVQCNRARAESEEKTPMQDDIAGLIVFFHHPVTTTVYNNIHATITHTYT